MLRKILIALQLQLAFLASYGQQKELNIVNFGAKPDGVTNNVIAIQKAIDAAANSGGGRVIIPRGRFVSGVIRLRSNVELNIHEEAVLLASTNRADYGPSLKVSAFIVANNEKNIAITGKGLIDGQCDLLIADIYKKLISGELYDDEWKEFNPWHQRRPSESNRPRMIEFKDCDGVTIKNVRMQNAAAWVQNYRNCSNVIIDSINVFSNTFLNNDGIDLVDCRKARITNCFVNAADDGICLKSQDRDKKCEDIYIADCKVRSSASAIKLGTASRGGFKNITIRNIYVYDTFRSAIAIESVDGGLIENIDVRNINAVNTGNAIFIRLGHRNKDEVYSQLRNVYIRNVKVQIPITKPDKGYTMDGPELRVQPIQKTDTTVQYVGKAPWHNYSFDTISALIPHRIFPSSITGLPGHYVENVKLEDIEIVYDGYPANEYPKYPVPALKDIPEASASYPEFSMFGELPAWALYVRHVKGLQMKNVSFKLKNNDNRAAFVFDDAERLGFENVSVPNYQQLPLVIMNKVKEADIAGLNLPAGKGKAVKVQ